MSTRRGLLASLALAFASLAASLGLTTRTDVTVARRRKKRRRKKY